MKIYKAMVDGRNCWANFDGTNRRLGFVTARFARSNHPEQAAALIRQKVAEELNGVLLNKEEDVPEIIIGEISETDEAAAIEIPNAGCTWYPDDHPPSN
jgi:hypothetical protein